MIKAAGRASRVPRGLPDPFFFISEPVLRQQALGTSSPYKNIKPKIAMETVNDALWLIYGIK